MDYLKNHQVEILQKIDETSPTGYFIRTDDIIFIEENWELIPETWIFQVFENDKLLLSQEFCLTV